MRKDPLPAEVRTLSNPISQVEDSELRRELLLAVADMLRALVWGEGAQEYYN